ncbi:MAG TPA: carotenoid biosynthesis protein [Candidatus Eisenbacteria bacterium]|nr:carotenoid biosynthesis protein [Candidatus Eisenbacteria bacterium]
MNVIPWMLLSIQALIVIASLAGYGIFTARPDWLAQVDPGARFFVWAFHGFAVGNMVFGGLAAFADILLRHRVRGLAAFAAVYLVSLASELAGTAFGVPFGAYAYTSLLGPKWLDSVPVLIPLSWFTVSWAAWRIAHVFVRGLAAVAFGTWLLVAWDLLLDPAMSKVTSYWVWGESGSYYGMPLTNLAGWAITGFVLLAALARLVPRPGGGARLAAAIYGVNFLLPLGFCALNGYWMAVVAALGSLGAGFALFSRYVPTAGSSPGGSLVDSYQDAAGR